MMTWFSPVLGQHPSPSTTKDDQIKKTGFSSQCICFNSVLFYDKKQLLFSRAEAVIARAYEWVSQEVPRWKENKCERRKKGNKPEKRKEGNRPERRSVNSRLELFFFSNNFYTWLTLYATSLRATYRLYYKYIIYDKIILLTIGILYVSFLFCLLLFFTTTHTLLHASLPT